MWVSEVEPSVAFVAQFPRCQLFCTVRRNELWKGPLCGWIAICYGYLTRPFVSGLFIILMLYFIIVQLFTNV